MAISPTAEGFRAAVRRPSLTAAEITWRWATGATATGLFFFGLFEFLNTLPVSNTELLFLRSRQPYLVSQALAHILRGHWNHAIAAGLVAVVMWTLLWVVSGSLGRMATVRALRDYFRKDLAASKEAEPTNSTARRAAFQPLVRLNFLRATVAMAAIVGLVGAAIVAGFASPAASPQPALAFLLFLLMAALVCLIAWGLNWLLSLAGMFAVREGADTLGAISSAVAFCRERAGAVAAVSTWTGLAHLVAFVGATMVVSMPMGLAGVLPGRAVVFCMTLVTLVYLALADWLYMARLAGYVCILEMPPAPAASPEVPIPPPPPAGMRVLAPVRTTIDRDELILSDIPEQP